MNNCAELSCHNWLCLLLLIHLHVATNWLFSYIFVVFFQDMKILKLSLGNHIVRKTTEHFLHKNQRTLFCKENHKLYYELHNYKIQRIILWGNDKNQCWGLPVLYGGYYYLPWLTTIRKNEFVRLYEISKTDDAILKKIKWLKWSTNSFRLACSYLHNRSCSLLMDRCSTNSCFRTLSSSTFFPPQKPSLSTMQKSHSR